MCKKNTKNVIVDFLNAGPEELEAQVLQGKRDVVIGPYTERYANLTYVSLFQERQSLYLSKHHKLFSGKNATASREALKGNAFVSRRYLHSLDLLRVGQSDPQAIVDSMEAQLILIQSGEYFGYLPEHYAQNLVSRGELQALDAGEFSYDSHFYAVYITQRIPNQLIKKFMNVLLEDCAAQAKQI